MKKLEYLYEPHLVLKEFSVSTGKEWLPKLPGWSLVRIGGGNGYWLQEQPAPNWKPERFCWWPKICAGACWPAS